MENRLIEVKNLYRYYSKQCAVNNVNFSLNKGEILGFLGLNGAGKSTTMQMIAGNLAPSSGEIFISGIDLKEQPKDAKMRLGFLPEQPPLYHELSVDEYLTYCAKLHRIATSKVKSAVDTAKQRCGLGQTGQRLINNLSKGYKQRVGIAQAIIHSPEVIILDEPTVGLDPVQIMEIRKLITELGQEHGVILSTHILPEVQATCTHVQVIHQGQLIFNAQVSQLQTNIDNVQDYVLGFRSPPKLKELLELNGVIHAELEASGKFRCHFENNQPEVLSYIMQTSLNRDWELIEMTPKQQSLEQIFVDLVSGNDAKVLMQKDRE